VTLKKLKYAKMLQDYDTDKMFPGLGFGARIPPAGEVCKK
jgi:hypothetical protein